MTMSAASTPNRRGAPAGAAGRRTPTTNNTPGAPSRSPSRMTTTGSATAAATNGLTRTQSKRGTPLPPRSAAAAGRRQTATPDPAEEDAKAEMAAKMEELQQRLNEAELAHQEAQKQAAVLQVKLDEALKEQGMLEEKVHEAIERNEELENEKKDSLRARREMEQIYESEKAAANKEKEEAMAREEEMQHAMQRMKETLAQKELRAGVEDDRRPMVSRQSSQGRSSNPSPNADRSDRQFAPPAISRSDSTSRSNSKLVMQKDKIIESLRLELAEAEMKLVEAENMGGGRLQRLQTEVYETKMQNGRLMEENESLSTMLMEKTLSGDFHLKPPSNIASRPPSRRQETSDVSEGGKSLADELDAHADSEGDEGSDHSKRLQAEVHSLNDQNKALTLYINNIISRLLQHEQFEAILDNTPDLMAGPNAASRGHPDTDKDLPPPPPSKDEQPSLLQRAKSVMGGKSKPRPLSQSVNPDLLDTPLQTPSVEIPRTEDPATAPRVPIGRSNSRRGNSSHRRANSEWAAANVVTSMYRGPPSGPLSPTLGSPTGVGNRNSFFGGNLRALSSNSQVPTISEDHDQKENGQPQRDSKMSEARSNRNSIQSSIAGGAFDNLDDPQAGGIASERSNPSSPPQSTTSSGDKDNRAPSGAIMMGSKPRPLRLVQEAADEDAAKKQSNRGSWFGFMNQGLKAPGSSSGSKFGSRSNSGDPPVS